MRASRRSGIVSSESEVTRTASCGAIFLPRTQASTDASQRLGFCIERKRSVSVKSPCTARVEPDAQCEVQIVRIMQMRPYAIAHSAVSLSKPRAPRDRLHIHRRQAFMEQVYV